MDIKSAENIELDKVLAKIRSYSLSKEGSLAIGIDKFTNDKTVLDSRYLKIDQYINLLDEQNPIDRFPSIVDIFEFVKRSHADIEGSGVYKVGEFLKAYFSMKRFLHEEEDIHTEDVELCDEILSSLDVEGDVVENHPRLLPLIKAREELKAERYRYSSQYINTNRTLVQNTNPVYRNERVVIPIKSDQKRNDEVYVMGSSSSGSTLFVEPFALVELNNKVVLSEERIRAEKMRIKHELSEKVRFLVPVLKKMMELVIDFDFHYAFALWAKKSKSIHPEISDGIQLIEARHPLLGEKAVPITLKLDPGTKALVLSGANAGGKTVSMKTVALLSALNQICSFIPARFDSKLPLFDDILSDIGDGQSIEQSFSTFSGHMSNIANITRKSTKDSLVLFDELGSGTDPEEGASLSIAILSYMTKHSRLTLATSHYGQVKNFAYSEKNMLNASMEFDEKSDKPTFRILEGIPGDSHAIATAIRARMPKEIVDGAQSLIASGDATSASIIKGLLSKSRVLDRKISEQDNTLKEIKAQQEKVKAQAEELQARELLVEKYGHKELADYLSDTRKKLEKIIFDLTTGKLTKDKIKNAKNFIDESIEYEKSVEKDIKKKERYFSEKEETIDFDIGEEIISKSANTRGKILDKRGKNKYYVSFENGLRMVVSSSMLVPAKKEKSEVAHFKSSQKKAQFVLDVRGRTLQEALEIIDDQLEAALLDNLSSFSIIHGYGDGILQRGINDYLKGRREVKSLNFARPEDGGMGKTYVSLSF